MRCLNKILFSRICIECCFIKVPKVNLKNKRQIFYFSDFVSVSFFFFFYFFFFFFFVVKYMFPTFINWDVQGQTVYFFLFLIQNEQN